jgi:muramoyltetrapeptide carboxypeptidase
MTSDSKPLAGRRIRVVAPARWVTEELAEAFVERMARWGAAVDVDPQCFKRDGQLAGSDAVREKALAAALADEELDVVWAARGGYGALRLLDRLAKRPAPKAKVFVGYSDITAIQQQLWGSGATAVHAAMPHDLMTSEKAANVDYAVAPIAALLAGAPVSSPVGALQAVAAGKAAAPLVPANLSVLACLIGTPFEPRWESAILCLEDVEEYLYAIDRMVWRLAASALGARIKGIVLGEFAKTQDNEIPWGRTVAEIAALHFPGVPIAAGLPFGHGAVNMPLVVGAPARLEVEGKTARLTLEPGAGA